MVSQRGFAHACDGVSLSREPLGHYLLRKLTGVEGSGVGANVGGDVVGADVGLLGRCVGADVGLLATPSTETMTILLYHVLSAFKYLVLPAR